MNYRADLRSHVDKLAEIYQRKREQIQTDFPDRDPLDININGRPILLDALTALVSAEAALAPHITEAVTVHKGDTLIVRVDVGTFETEDEMEDFRRQAMDVLPDGVKVVVAQTGNLAVVKGTVE